MTMALSIRKGSWLEEKNINVMPWPAQSPDLNPIKNMWMMVERKIGNQIFRNGHELFLESEKQWKAISINYIGRLILRTC